MNQVCNLPYYTLTFGVRACITGQAFLVTELSSTFPPNCHARKIYHLWMKRKVEGKVNFFKSITKKKRSYSPTLLSYTHSSLKIPITIYCVSAYIVLPKVQTLANPNGSTSLRSSLWWWRHLHGLQEQAHSWGISHVQDLCHAVARHVPLCSSQLLNRYSPMGLPWLFSALC